MEDLTIAVVGATGAVGAEFLRIVEQRYAKPPRLRLMASSRSAGKRIAVGGEELVVEEATETPSRAWTWPSSAPAPR